MGREHLVDSCEYSAESLSCWNLHQSALLDEDKDVDNEEDKMVYVDMEEEGDHENAVNI